MHLSIVSASHGLGVGEGFDSGLEPIFAYLNWTQSVVKVLSPVSPIYDFTVFTVTAVTVMNQFIYGSSHHANVLNIFLNNSTASPESRHNNV